VAFLVGSPDIERILDKPGAVWLDQERVRVETWLNVPPQLGMLLRYVLRHLGRGATAADAEDAWQQFCLDELDDVIVRSDPARGLRLQAYLLMCLRQFSWRRGARLRVVSQAEAPIERAVHDGESRELDIVAPGDDPEKKAVVSEAHERLRRCIATLKPQYRDVVVRHHLQEDTVVAIADALGIGESLVKIRLLRGRRQLKQCLSEGV
jgi:RNA polymerase sigma factor (sigma-70 family)